MNKVALFDFCETLANFQTADAYVRYVMRKRKVKKGLNYWTQIFLEKSKLSAILFRLGINVNKFMLLANLKELPENVLKEDAKGYYEDVIKPNLIAETIQELRQKQMEGYQCIIVSGGYDVYLRHFAEEYSIDKVLCSRLKFKDGVFTGRLLGKDCMGKEKARIMSKEFGTANLKCIDSISYSDSRSDMPFLNYTRRAVVVARKKAPQWAVQHKFETLLWQR